MSAPDLNDPFVNTANPSARHAALPVEVDEVVKGAMSPQFRLWLYGVCLAAIPLLVAFGKMNGDQASLWTDFVSSILAVTGLTTAIANVKR